MQVGFIGLGTMGAGMAANLQKAGYKLVVHDIRQDSATAHLRAGAKWEDSPKAVAAQCQVIFTSAPLQSKKYCRLGAAQPARPLGRSRVLRRREQ